MLPIILTIVILLIKDKSLNLLTLVNCALLITIGLIKSFINLRSICPSPSTLTVISLPSFKDNL